MQVKEETITFGKSKLVGVVTFSAKQPSCGSVVIAHGAGRGLDSPLLEQTAHELSGKGLAVLRFNFGYLGKRPAPSAGGKNEQPELIEAMDYAKNRFETERLILIGKSFGARIISYVSPDRKDVLAAVFYGLPLQGMSAKSKPRDWSHLASLKVPVLFITGNKDKLCPLETLKSVQSRMDPGSYTSEIVPGDHSFKPKSESRASKLCVKWIDTLVQ